MALIKCPECGKEISDKSNICIHCGFPLKNCYNANSNNNLFKIHEISSPESTKQYRIYWDTLRRFGIYDYDYETFDKTKLWILASGLTKENAEYMKSELEKTGAVIELVEETEDVTKDTRVNNNIEMECAPVKCPKCGSTQITTGKRGFKITTGFLGSSSPRNFCAKCGHVWKP